MKKIDWKAIFSEIMGKHLPAIGEYPDTIIKLAINNKAISTGRSPIACDIIAICALQQVVDRSSGVRLNFLSVKGEMIP
jgi:hypothetical protein